MTDTTASKEVASSNDQSLTGDAALARLLASVIADGGVAETAWPAALADPELYGLCRERSLIRLPPDTELLSRSSVLNAMTAQARTWLKDLEIHLVIGSTNDRLMGRAGSERIAGAVCLAELQTKGRGRRGRSWFSPFARNLALSVGVTLNRPMAEAGGLSLMVGLAVVDALRDAGVNGLGLKWPNDIMLGEAKLGGVLIELVGRAPGADAVIGVGLNVSLPAAVRRSVPQAVVDLASAGYPVSRNRLAGRLVSALVEHVRLFEKEGFAPARDRFNREHVFHRRECQIAGLAREVVGQVVGVTEFGELMLETSRGVETFGAGEVSLRGT